MEMIDKKKKIVAGEERKQTFIDYSLGCRHYAMSHIYIPIISFHSSINTDQETEAATHRERAGG